MPRFARAATETPQPITNTFSTPVTVDGKVYAPGQLIYPGFDADLLWKFRWYSLIDQALIWAVLGLVFGWLVERYVGGHYSSSRTDTERLQHAGCHDK